MKRILRDNRGSGIVTVLICVTLIMLLGATLLFTTYTGYKIRASERKSGESFYSAEMYMSEIRAGVQQAVTESIGAAYSKVMVRYSELMKLEETHPGATEEAFHAAFTDALFRWEYISAPLAAAEPLIQTGKYIPETLGSFITTPLPAGATIAVSSESGGAVVADDTRVTLKGVKLTYTQDGYETNISTDITVALPGFTHSLSEYLLVDVPTYALIAKEGLSQDTGGSAGLKLTGNAYVGDITLTENGNKLTVSGGALICGGDVSVNGALWNDVTRDNARLVVEKSSALWTGGILVGAGSSVSLCGDTYVADDLELRARSTALLGSYDAVTKTYSGRYYGFGSGGTATASSSMIVNGTGAKLDLSGLGELMLAGHSFISAVNYNDTGVSVGMGQSLSVKSDQRAYLVPASCLTGPNVTTNPHLIPNINATNPALNMSFADWGVNVDALLWGSGKSLRDYGLTDAGDFAVVYTRAASEPTLGIVYLYMLFDESETGRQNANKFFSDYFDANSEEVTEYLELYVELDGTNAARSAGDVYATDGAGVSVAAGVEPGAATASLTTAATRRATMYANLCKTLSSNVSGAANTTPYEYVLNTAAIAALGGSTTEFTNGAGEVVALIVKNPAGEYKISEMSAVAGSKVSVLIATGDVLVDREFTGLIISGGTVTLQKSLTADLESVPLAFDAVNAAGQTLRSFLNVSTSGGGSDSEESTWETDTLVSYSNWKKY